MVREHQSLKELQEEDLIQRTVDVKVMKQCRALVVNKRKEGEFSELKSDMTSYKEGNLHDSWNWKAIMNFN